MPEFKDYARIFIKSGKGGDGCVSFRREKYVANGGPDGGDGGKGGDVVFVVEEGINTLSDFHRGGKYLAQNGENGAKRRCAGKKGQDKVIRVPEGTVIKEAESGKVIADMSGENKRQVVLTGGRGGNGNQHYATSTMQVPRYAQPGQPAKELEVILELKVIADVGLAGFPNVGKSTFLTKVSNARPKVANYHFTTLTPSLGVVDLDDSKGFVVADIPGLIEGASEGLGLGHEFLRHIERTRLILHVVDAAGTEGRDPLEDIEAINKELSAYGADLKAKPQIIAANKIDMLQGGAQDEMIEKIRATYEPQGVEVFAISALTGEGIKELLYHINDRLKMPEQTTKTFAPEYFPDEELLFEQEDFTVFYDQKEKMYVAEGPKIEKMLGYTNLEAEKGFVFFQNFMRDQGIIDALKKIGMEEGDTVRIYGYQFEYLDDDRTAPMEVNLLAEEEEEFYGIDE